MLYRGARSWFPLPYSPMRQSRSATSASSSITSTSSYARPAMTLSRVPSSASKACPPLPAVWQKQFASPVTAEVCCSPQPLGLPPTRLVQQKKEVARENPTRALHHDLFPSYDDNKPLPPLFFYGVQLPHRALVAYAQQVIDDPLEK
jgi:hypothetical protein